MSEKPSGTQENGLLSKVTENRKRGKSLSNPVPLDSDQTAHLEAKRGEHHSVPHASCILLDFADRFTTTIERSHSQTQIPTQVRASRKLTEAEEYARSVQLREESATTEAVHRRSRAGSGISQEAAESRRTSITDAQQLRRESPGTLTPVGASTHHYSKLLTGSGPDTRRGSQFRASQYRTSPSPDTGSYTHQSHIHALNFSSYPPELPAFLDGTHHTDELATHFEVGWPVLEKWLVALGNGQGNGDFGRVAIMYR